MRLAYCPAANRSSQVPVTLEHADGRCLIVVNQKQPPKLDGHFVSLGVFHLTPDKPAMIDISNTGTDGFVSVDAVKVLKVASER